MTQSSFFPCVWAVLRRVVTLAAFVGLLLVTLVPAQTPVVLAPVPKLQFFDANGKPLAFGCVFSYQTLSSTPLSTYTDYTGSIQNTNPVVLNSSGFVGTGGLWLQAGVAYRLVVKSAGSTNCSTGSTISTVDGIGGGTTTLTTIVPYSATPTFAAAAQNQLFEITLTGNATSQPLTAVGITPPAVFTWQITQDGAGGHTFTWPINVIGGQPPTSNANSISQQTFIWNGSIAIAAGPVTYDFGGVSGFGTTQLYDFGLSANSPVCTGTAGNAFLLMSSCNTVFAVTYNGVTVNPGGSGNVNAGAGTHSIALNEGAGAAISGLMLSNDQIPQGSTGADPSAVTLPNCPNGLGYNTSSHAWGCAPAIQANSTTQSGSDQGVSANTNTTVLTKSITMPSTGCPCRVFGSYGMFLSTGNSGVQVGWINDGNDANAFATAQNSVTGSTSAFGLNGSEFSHGTYANSANVTFNLRIEVSNSGGVTVKQNNNNNPTTAEATWLNLAVFTSN